ncbi:glycerol-3-phosphate 1-O-acyltransferase PlsY [Desulfonema magnum]|uniref:Glycerol-3-phosphate acyltransferase n=1 Tax=Desulfonema magnum TaxID=45655 RepID=A0A975BUE6_9BACT|nr:glycerol-3-phosphate 1-O-acyltransferase PlsY [Desulfonema magnum]QTA91434.1 Glycerol-3-phosphate 1-O-acyltransferase [Desulfonema magnum]
MEFLKILEFFLLPLFAYLLGSVPWGLILTRIFTSQDITQKGSGNIGATNVRRVAGTTLGLLTLLGDISKGAVPVYIAISMTGLNDMRGELFVSLVSLSAFSGHLCPVFTKFKKGGKGVATAAGCFLVISPMACFVTVLVFILFICWQDRVSVSSLAAAAVLPVAVWEAVHSEIITGCAVIITLFIYLRHKDNIRRILSGTELTG